jgi:hypothetical protein
LKVREKEHKVRYTRLKLTSLEVVEVKEAAISSGIRRAREPWDWFKQERWGIFFPYLKWGQICPSD